MPEWVKWWRNGWRQDRHCSWPSPVELRSPALRHAFCEYHHRRWIDRFFGVAPAAIPWPATGYITLITWTESEWQRLFRLCFSVCCGRVLPRQCVLSDQDAQWCRRLAKGLKPGWWLPPAVLTSRDPDLAAMLLLRCWTGEAVWLRMRFRLPKDKVERLPQAPAEPVAAKQLSALWQALIVYVASSSP